MKIATFDDMIAAARQAGPVPVAVAAAHDPEVLKAVARAQGEGMVQATLVGDRPAIEAHAAAEGLALEGMHLTHEPHPGRAAAQVVAMARLGGARVVVKGQIKTGEILGAALDRHSGIRAQGLLTHVGIFELPGLDRLLYLSDSGVMVHPDVSQKLEIINNVVAVAHLFGLDCPRVAILAASETVHPKIPASIDALALAKMAEQGRRGRPPGAGAGHIPPRGSGRGECLAHRWPGRCADRAQRGDWQHRCQGPALLCPCPDGRIGGGCPGADPHQLPGRQRRNSVPVPGHGGRTGGKLTHRKVCRGRTMLRPASPAQRAGTGPWMRG
jgi:hypothetical protein